MIIMNQKKSAVHEEDISLKAFVVLSRAFQSIRKRVEEDIKDLGLNPTEFAVLELIYNKGDQDRKSTRLNSSHVSISYAVFCLKKKKRKNNIKKIKIKHIKQN